MSYQDLYVDLYVAERLMELRVKDAHRQAAMRRLQSEARAGRSGWATRQRCRLLCQLCRLFKSLGEWLLQHGQVPALPVEAPADGSA